MTTEINNVGDLIDLLSAMHIQLLFASLEMTVDILLPSS